MEQAWSWIGALRRCGGLCVVVVVVVVAALDGWCSVGGGVWDVLRWMQVVDINYIRTVGWESGACACDLVFGVPFWRWGVILR